jgi:hypothetical protein
VRAKAALDLAVGESMQLSAKEKSELTKLITYGLDRNPRRVKRLFNALAIASDEAGVSKKDRLTLAKILVLQMRFPSFYRALRKDPGLVQKLENGSHEWPDSDGELRTFIEETKAIKLDTKSARRSIRVAGRNPAEDDDEVAASSTVG